MASNFTANYQLNQWEAEDAVRRVDFNEDNAKIDAAIKAVDQRVDGKADTSALSSLSSRVDSLAGTVSAQGNVLNGKGNCQIQLTTYVGTGTDVNTIPLPSNTLLVIIHGQRNQLAAARGATDILCHGGSGSGGNVIAQWTDSSLTLTARSGDFTGSHATCNQLNVTYYMVIFRTA